MQPMAHPTLASTFGMTSTLFETNPRAPVGLPRVVVPETSAPILGLLQHPDERLRIRSEPVMHFDASLRDLAQSMAATMKQAGGIGLAAPQVNHHVRLVVMRLGEAVVALANPCIDARQGEQEEINEGCLSVPGRRGAVRRAARVRIRAHDLEGHPVLLGLEGLEAVCIQHEIDHLDGILFIDRLAEQS